MIPASTDRGAPGWHASYPYTPMAHSSTVFASNPPAPQAVNATGEVMSQLVDEGPLRVGRRIPPMAAKLGKKLISMTPAV